MTAQVIPFPHREADLDALVAASEALCVENMRTILDGITMLGSHRAGDVNRCLIALENACRQLLRAAK